jgi:hypothetical protein
MEPAGLKRLAVAGPSPDIRKPMVRKTFALDRPVRVLEEGGAVLRK